MLIELSYDEALAAAVMLPMVAADRLAPSASSHHDHPAAQLIFARPINDHVHRTPRPGQWVLISAGLGINRWIGDFSAALTSLDPRSHRLVDRRGRGDDLGRPGR